MQSLAERSSLYISLWNICIKKWQGLIYTAEQVADMIMNDDIGEIESTDSLNKKSSSFSSDDEPSCQFEACSSNDELSFQSEVDNSSNSDSEFMLDESLLKNVLLEIVLWSVKKREEGSQTMVELSKQEVSFQTMGELSELEEAFQTMGEEPWGQEEGSRIVWQEIILILPTRKWTRQWAIMLVKQNDIVEKSADTSEQQYATMDDGNPNESNADINISETTAVDQDIGSNNKADDSTSNDTW